MPVIDGYRATHLIRHHAPYSTAAKDIPIVAMTASAIQGDREKCKKAGMDDYLAKPVKGKTLEKMLVRWVTQKRSPGTPSSDDPSDCSEPGVHEYPNPQTRPSLERQISHHLTLPGPESEADRVARRSQAEEMATRLRDDKLIVAAGGSDEGLVPHESGPPGQQLTMENVGRLERAEQERGAPEPRMKNGVPVRGSMRNVSVEVERGSRLPSMATETAEGETQLQTKRSPSRPKYDRRWRDSERTVTGPSG
jgi:hypothetical protein